jgi:prepilin-type processing-associated H-X9-DG protein
MIRRPMILPFTVLLLAGLAALPACDKKKKTNESGGDDNAAPAQVDPAPVSGGGSDYVLFAHLRAKDIVGSDVFAEIKKAVAKEGATAEWDEIENKVAKEMGGIKPSDIDSVTACVTEVPERDVPKFILIVNVAKPINKAGIQAFGKMTPDAGGFYKVGNGGLIHFPDDKTFVVLHPDLKGKYLGGYAKNRTGWPHTPELTRAASGHTLYAIVHADKVPKALTRSPDLKEFEGVIQARTVSLTADLKGKELSVAARATYPDAATAGKAKSTVQNFVKMAIGQVDQVLKGKGPSELADFLPAVQEARRALTDAKIEVSGSDLVVSGKYKADFDVGAMVAGAAKKVRSAASRMKDSNSLKQIGIALHNYHDTYSQVVVHAVGPNALPLKNPKDKPLLSWRVALLPYLEHDNLYRQFKLDEPWDSPHNKKLVEKMPAVYAPPKPGKPGYTHLQMVVGPNAMQPVGARIPGSFPDGTSNTIAVAEAAQPVIWTKPDDIMLPGKALPKDLKKKFGGLHPGGFNVLLWDGSVRFIKDSVSDATLGRALNPRDGMVLGSDW